MAETEAPSLLICAHDLSVLSELRRLLGASAYEISGYLFGMAEPDDFDGYDLVVIDGSRCQEQAVELAHRLSKAFDDICIPLLFLTDDPAPALRVSAFEAGVDVCLVRPFASGELFAQVKSLLRFKQKHDGLLGKTAEIHRINKRLQAAYQQIDQELELAQRIQSSFLPKSLPTIDEATFSVQYLLCGRVGGDFYDVFRLDENHVGFYVADAMGHGVPASLLTIFVKKGVRAKEVHGNEYRLVPPAEVLSRLNRDLIDQHLSESPFITMVYGILDHREGAVSIARAGHPYPLHIPKDGECQYWKQSGLLLGVLDATFPGETYSMKPGDKVLFYSDGIDKASFEDHAVGPESLLACALHHRELPVDEFVRCLARDMFGASELADDVTLFAIEMNEPSG